jgi:hypothetical protein
VLTVNSSITIADGAGLIERLHGPVVVASAEAGEAAAVVQFLVPEGKVGETMLFAAAIDGFDPGHQAHVDGCGRSPTAAHADFAAGRKRVIECKSSQASRCIYSWDTYRSSPF